MSRSSRPVFVTTDFDFFVWDGSRATIKVFPGDPEKEDEIPGMMFFDWGHGENFCEVVAKTQWASRIIGFDRAGLSIEEVVAIDPSRKCVLPGDFARELDKHLDTSGAATFMSDSHLFAYMALQYIGEPADVVNFDAHCDLGYNERVVKQQLKDNEYDCASWAYHALDAGIAASYTVVYPDWLGYGEWEERRDNPLVTRWGNRVKATTWSEWLKKKSGRKRVEVVHHARSSNWVPPYLDEEFLKHAARIGDDPKLCFDCEPLGSYPKIGAYDSCVPRTWWDEVKQMALSQKKTMEELFGAL